MVVATLAVLATGDKEPPSTANSPSAASSGVPRGWTLADRSSHGFAISLPPGWEETHVDLEESIEFQAGHLALGSQEFTPNVNVVVEDLPPDVTLDQYANANLINLRESNTIQSGFEQERVILPSGPAHRFQYRARYDASEGSIEVVLVQFMAIGGGRGYAITFAALPSQFEAEAEDFEAIASSLRFTGA